MIELIPVVAITALVYVIARTVSYAEASHKATQKEKLEQQRKKRIDELYGR